MAEHLLYVYEALGSILGTSDVFKRERGLEGWEDTTHFMKLCLEFMNTRHKEPTMGNPE